jgi:glycyl-tRNA synthetase beta chain
MSTTELFIEIGTEEIPARFIQDAQASLEAGVAKLLGTIPHGAIRGFSTPRRLAVAVSEVAAAKASTERLITGPASAIAFTETGAPTAAGEAFARKNQQSPASLFVHETPKGKVAALYKREGGESTESVVAAGLEALIVGIPFKKTMRAGNNVRFVRPVQYICARIGNARTGYHRIEAMVAGMFTTDTSRGHFLHRPEPFTFGDAISWLTELRARCVLADPGERRGELLRQLRRVAEDIGADPEFDAELIEEVLNLVEWPKVLVGRFDAGLLSLPSRLLVEAMKKHQRYFPVFRNGELTNEFLVVSNNPFGDEALIAEGNARVLAARFYDARFFYAEDCKSSLKGHGTRLSGMTWIRGLGSMQERQAEIAEAAVALSGRTGAELELVRRAGALSKCDLTTQMVGEFPELQGHVGRLLALKEGEPVEVAIAIEEHYLPRFAGDYLPQSPAGRALALAERLSLLIRCFAAGIKPGAGADPQGLRRAALGVVQILIDSGLRGDIRSFLQEVSPSSPAMLIEEVALFIQARLKALLIADHPTDLVEAVIAASGMDLSHDAERVRAMSRMVADGSFAPIRITFKRAGGLVKEHASSHFDPACFVSDAEGSLAGTLNELGGQQNLEATLQALLKLRPIVDHFFDAVLVMCDDPVLQANRLGLLKAVTQSFAHLADFTRLSSD